MIIAIAVVDSGGTGTRNWAARATPGEDGLLDEQAMPDALSVEGGKKRPVWEPSVAAKMATARDIANYALE